MDSEKLKPTIIKAAVGAFVTVVATAIVGFIISTINPASPTKVISMTATPSVKSTADLRSCESLVTEYPAKADKSYYHSLSFGSAQTDKWTIVDIGNTGRTFFLALAPHRTLSINSAEFVYVWQTCLTDKNELRKALDQHEQNPPDLSYDDINQHLTISMVVETNPLEYTLTDWLKAELK